VKKREKTAKYERDSCIPWPKNGERPYLAPSVPGFSGLIFADFWRIFDLISCSHFISTHQPHPAHTSTLLL